MTLFHKMDEYKGEASWAVWDVNTDGRLTGSLPFPIEQALPSIHGRAMFVSLNPGSDWTTGTPDWSNFHSPDAKHNDIFLAEALVGTAFWGSYMVDLHPDVVESDSRLVRPKREEIELSVRSLIRQAKMLGDVQTIACVGKSSYDSVVKLSRLIQADLELSHDAIVGIPHYSLANSGVHKRDPQRYRDLVNAKLSQVAT